MSGAVGAAPAKAELGSVRMVAKRMSKRDMPLSFGTFKPVGHVVLAFDNDTRAAEAAQALKECGFDDEDVLLYTAAEMQDQMEEKVSDASGAAGFGYEITLMRRYEKLAAAGAGWLVVYAPQDDDAQRVTEVARRLRAQSAVRYHLLANEDLV